MGKKIRLGDPLKVIVSSVIGMRIWE
jgi:hypothetical protein